MLAVRSGYPFNDSYITHFAQPDSIIPDGNPQSLNRYAYVDNNPINFNDPSGHVAADCGLISSSSGRAACENASATPEEKLSNYGVTLSGNWQYDDAFAAYVAVLNVGDKLSANRNLGGTASEAFSTLYGTSSKPLVLTWDNSCYSCRTDEANKLCKNDFTSANCLAGGVTLGSHAIRFGGLSPIYPGYDNGIRNIVHELGHVFSRIHGGLDDPLLATFTKNQDIILKSGELRSDGSGYDIWRFHPNGGPSEMFADMFVAYISGTWGEGLDPIGYRTQAEDWMNNEISGTAH